MELNILKQYLRTAYVLIAQYLFVGSSFATVASASLDEG